MATSERLPTAIGVFGVVLVTATTIPAVKQLTTAISRPKKLYGGEFLYKDDDGVATEETASAYSDKVPKCILYFASICLLLLQTAALSLERLSVNRFDLGIYGAFSCVSLAIVVCLENWLFTKSSRGDPIYSLFTFLQVTAAILTSSAYVSLPRRPDIFKDGRAVDRQFTVSAISRYSFAWCGPLLKFAASNRRLEMEDLPALDSLTNSNNLQQRFHAMQRNGKLWKLVFWSHATTFVRQWVLTLLASVAGFAPQLCMYRILQLLEKRGLGDQVAMEAWWWVAGLGAGQIAEAWLEAWLFWICWCLLCVPVRSQLSALIFQKTMRKKDAKGLQGVGTKKGGPAIGETPEVIQELDKGSKDVDPEDEIDAQKSKQGTIKYDVSQLPSFEDNLMKERDNKMAVVTEALQGIRQIKLMASERAWHAKIMKVRERELGQQWKVFKADSVLLFCWIVGPVMLAAVSLAVYTIIHSDLSPSIAFTTLAIFSRLEVTLAVIPELTTYVGFPNLVADSLAHTIDRELLDAMVSIDRIEKYLDSPEKKLNTAPGDMVSFQNASVAWPSDDLEEHDRYILRNVNVSFPNRALSVISGKTGSGKSLLLASILGESDVLSGSIQVPRAPPIHERYDHKATKDNWIIPSSIAFVAQIPWIENATIKDNILFGLPHDTARYQKVVKACALEKDLEMLIDGEMTEIGANGINLSGGQRWRMSFARALYSRAGILVLDDIFSAVDAHVGRHIFEEGLTGELAHGRTRILVTHHVALCLPRTEYAVMLGDGAIEHAGAVADLQRSGSLEGIFSHGRGSAMDRPKDGQLLLPEDSAASAFSDINSERPGHACVAGGNSDMGTSEGAEGKNIVTPRKFVEEEKRETGRIKWEVYRQYLRSSGGVWFWAMAVAAFVGYEVVLLSRSWWVKVWTSSFGTEAMMAHYSYYSLQSSTSSTESADSLWYYLGIYIGLSIIVSFSGVFKYWWIFCGSIRASRELFDKLSFAVVRAPLRWLDTVPTGRILNRFTSDFNIIDSRMANDVAFLTYNILQVLGIVVAGLFVSPYMMLIAVLLLGFCLHYARRYLAGAREVKRLESNAKSPVFELFGASLTGVGTIRAFGKGDEYVNRMFSRIDDHARTLWHLWLFNRWMGFRMAMVGAVFAILVAAIIVSIKGIDASLAGFAISFALDFTQSVIWMVRRYANTDCERVIEYSQLPIEDQSGLDAPAAWPQEGRLSVTDLVVGYAPDLPPVLKGLSFSVERNQRVGVVGRTGAGKSSLTLALFRFLEAREGSIHIDGLDISKIKLHDLRSRLAIIPQDPVLFSGTVRSNLDAFSEHTDAELCDALGRVHLVHTVSRDDYTSNSDTNINVFEDLSSRISEGGLNLSQGQRQLLCLARAIVGRPKIIILDEATSAVDMATDALIQRSIREEFGNSTLLVIAHRLSTIADFDRILVMNDGRAVEYGDPQTLMEAKGEFWEMVTQSGERAKLEELILGRHN
ncbi:hypothetical protein FGG08_005404 [Glutinoglossum americanum]|uniref:Uncharacterized protein n=1 Tax=Glutinoglossum americanum TaxID=1670608 RepID=A0A9P8I319_9PEZI|nr:hypothetical protein FGG08_005404 [Glutinoglossum americanum]